MKTIALLITTFLISTTYAQTNSIYEKLNEKIPILMKAKKAPGMAIAIFEKGDLDFIKGFGLASISENRPITSSTGFNIGSISKLFTAFGVMKLVEDGKVDLDAPVETYLTRWKIPDSEFDKTKVTIRHLLNHTAGLSVHGYPGFIDKKALPTLELSLDGINGPARDNEKVEIVIEPQTKFQYSGGGYTVLQLVIEEVTEMSFEKYMEQLIFKPLKMNDTSFTINKPILKNSAIPYDENQQELPIEYFTAKAAAGLHTTLDDFILFAKDMLQTNTIVSQETLNDMITPSALSKNQYGLGFRVLRFGPLEFKGHAGSNTGWQSAFFFDFKTKSGLIMLTNGNEGDSVLKNTLKTWASLKFKR